MSIQLKKNTDKELEIIVLPTINIKNSLITVKIIEQSFAKQNKL